MKNLFSLVLLTASINATAQIYIPPDPYNDSERDSYGIWPNEGQIVDTQGDSVPDVSFYTSGALPRAYFQKSGLFSLVLATSDSSAGIDTLRRLDVACVGPHANYPNPVIWHMKDRAANFYLPQCAPNGATNVHAYSRVVYPDMYPHIDMDVYSGKLGQKLAFVINPGGDPKDIELMLTGQDSLELDVYGNLNILLSGKWVVLPEAVAYQVNTNNSTTPVNWTASYSVNIGEATVRFNFDTYDHNKPLVFLMGPAALGGGGNSYAETGICWSTYYGGDNQDYAKDAKADADGNYYVGGRTYSTFITFPQHPGDVSLVNATSEATLTKFTMDNEIQWTNYFGGLVNYSDMIVGAFPRGTFGEVVAVKEEPSTGIYLAGATTAPNLLIQPETNAYNDAGDGEAWRKGFIAKFDTAGALQWSTYFGTDANAAILGIDVVGTDRFVVSGIATDGLPVPPVPLSGALNQSYSGLTDGFLALFDANDQLLWRTYYGGSQQESGVLVKSNASSIFLAGNTRSSDISPVEPSGCYHQSYQGNGDCFMASFTNGGVLEWATYLGGSGAEALGAKGLALDPVDRSAVLIGTTAGLDTLVHGNQWYDDTPTTTGKNGFITRFSGTNHSPLWISYLGSGAHHFPWSICIDQDGIISVGGYSDDPAFTGVPGAGLYNRSTYFNGGFDCFITQFDDDQYRIWNTLFGGETGPLTSTNIPENINSLNEINGSLYATGYTEKHGVSSDSYFPLDNQESTAWFNDLFNGNGTTYYGDGFITQFCSELSTGITSISKPSPEEDLHVLPNGPHSIVLSGLADGPHDLQIYDAQGRLVMARKVYSSADRTSGVDIGWCNSALYIIRVDYARTAKFIPLQ